MSYHKFKKRQFSEKNIREELLLNKIFTLFILFIS
jgi:hypothetical protein